MRRPWSALLAVLLALRVGLAAGAPEQALRFPTDAAARLGPEAAFLAALLRAGGAVHLPLPEGPLPSREQGGRWRPEALAALLASQADLPVAGDVAAASRGLELDLRPPRGGPRWVMARGLPRVLLIENSSTVAPLSKGLDAWRWPYQRQDFGAVEADPGRWLDPADVDLAVFSSPGWWDDFANPPGGPSRMPEAVAVALRDYVRRGGAAVFVDIAQWDLEKAWPRSVRLAPLGPYAVSRLGLAGGPLGGLSLAPVGVAADRLLREEARELAGSAAFDFPDGGRRSLHAAYVMPDPGGGQGWAAGLAFHVFEQEDSLAAAARRLLLNLMLLAGERRLAAQGEPKAPPPPPATATRTAQRSPTPTPTEAPPTPTLEPTHTPPPTSTPLPTPVPTPPPTAVPPTAVPTPAPAAAPIYVPPAATPAPPPATSLPTVAPTRIPPTPLPTAVPTRIPPTPVPTPVPTALPTPIPPTPLPTAAPTRIPPTAVPLRVWNTPVPTLPPPTPVPTWTRPTPLPTWPAPPPLPTLIRPVPTRLPTSRPGPLPAAAPTRAATVPPSPGAIPTPGPTVQLTQGVRNALGCLDSAPEPFGEGGVYLKFCLTHAAVVQAKVFDLEGRLLWASERRRAAVGSHQWHFDGRVRHSDLPPGGYLYQIHADYGAAGAETRQGRMTRVRSRRR